MTDLTTLLPPGSGWDLGDAMAINEAGQVVGGAQIASGESHAVLWQAGTLTDLGTLGGTISAATAINAAGQVVGYAGTASGDFHAFLWQADVMTDLNTLLPAGSGLVLRPPFPTFALAINDGGQIVGRAERDGTSHAVLLTPAGAAP